MKLKDIKEHLKCRTICEGKIPDIEIKYANASDLMSDLLAFAKPGALLLTGLTHNNVIRTCEITEIRAVIFVRNKEPSEDTIKLARNCNVPLFTTELTKFEACGILYSKGIKGVPIKKAE